MQQNLADDYKLIDRFDRRVTYLRMSVTDRCDFRCVYCMSEKMTFLPRAQILSLEELLAIGRAFSELGVHKIRITGGEPLVRRNIVWLLQQLNKLPGVDELVLTTNGSQLAKFAPALRHAGVQRINISLDSLQPDRFRQLTRVGDLNKVLQGIRTVLQAGFENVKINTVILKNRNHDEAVDLVNYAIDRGIDISFIEEMPLGQIAEHDRAELYYSSDELLAQLEEQFTLMPSTRTTGGPARYYHIRDTATHVGLISPHSHNFCSSCNRVRLTVEGRLLLCLGQEHSVDLRRVIRSHPGDSERLKQAIVESMAIKPKGHDFDLNRQPSILRFMNTTGG
jgi:cyclic pyranopterin phosphate synthase